MLLFSVSVNPTLNQPSWNNTPC